MTEPTHDEIERSRTAIVDLMRQEYAHHTVGPFDPYEFGNAVAPLVNALAALALIEKQERRDAGSGEASREDD